MEVKLRYNKRNETETYRTKETKLNQQKGNKTETNRTKETKLELKEQKKQKETDVIQCTLPSLIVGGGTKFFYRPL